ncbi:hypothetical protein, partial [Acidithiobacillus caldus]
QEQVMARRSGREVRCGLNGYMGRTFKTLLDDIGAHKNLVKVMDQMAVAGSRRRAGPLQDGSISPEPVQAKRGPAF